MVRGPYRAGKFPVMSLTWAPGRQQTSLRGGSAWHSGASVPRRRESPTTLTHFSFVVKVVVIWDVGLSDLGHTSGEMDRPPHLHPLTGLPHPEPPTCGTEAPGKVVVIWDVGLSDLRHTSGEMDRPPHLHPLTGLPHPEPPTCGTEAPGKSETPLWNPPGQSKAWLLLSQQGGLVCQHGLRSNRQTYVTASTPKAGWKGANSAPKCAPRYLGLRE
ncbi:uncharacterized protein LOC128909926 isoform X2 [Rissa tridactyla]|uniref:uncharacterized protein LOC128909926 isoform X2 n=1 Tax=Rissa tridactyla TaxID=75485 RepID=UPI0023BAE4FE|nr:uncharacterized protein LOC128909926 isoform X2 [Rissa tridactyla]